ncbi:MAG: 4Fe-4S binding protein, partial [Deltaproteobacteria bacterium]
MPTRYVQPLRVLVQICFLCFMLWLGIRFYQFACSVSEEVATVLVERPPGIEGFLPISGLLGLTAWIKGSGLNTIHPAAVVLFLTAIAVSLLLRRSFCSWICPVATVSECAWKSGFRLFRRNLRLPHALDMVLRGVKYILLAFFVYSIVIAMSTESLQMFIQSGYHKTADLRLLDFFLHISPMALAIVLFLLAISFAFRNPLCRYLCPYGALLGLAALLSPFRVTRDSESCVSCGVCSQVCPSRIDVMHKQSVTTAECIGCWRCISHCRVNQALSMRFAGRYGVPGILFAIM